MFTGIPTISILRQSSKVLQSFDLPLTNLLEDFDETVCQPPCELVERDEIVSLKGGLCLKDCSWPDVSKRFSPQCVSRWPDGAEAFDECIPESSNRDGSQISVNFRLSLEEI